MTRTNIIAATLAAALLAGCDSDPQTGEGGSTGAATTDATTTTGEPTTAGPTTAGPTTDPSTGDESSTTGSTQGETTGGADTTGTTGGGTQSETGASSTGEGETGSDSSGGTGSRAPSFDADVQPILDASCVVCHAPGGPASFLSYAEGAYENLVGVESSQAALNRVEPGDVEGSYLWHKINGTQGDVGGSGAQMPLGGGPLGAEDLATIEAWIAGGALP